VFGRGDRGNSNLNVRRPGNAEPNALARFIAPGPAAVSGAANRGTGPDRAQWSFSDTSSLSSDEDESMEAVMIPPVRTSAPLDMAAAQDAVNAARQQALDILEEAARQERSDPNMVAYDREGDPIDQNRVYGNTGREDIAML
jgi:hypothetical protein